MPQTAPAKQYLTLAAAAEHIGMNPRTLRRFVAEGRLRAYKAGPRSIRVTLADIDALMRQIPTTEYKA